MCGIVGGFGAIGSSPENSMVYIKHRGPDSEGIFRNESIFLGHTRLSIQDISEQGNQPMISSDNRYVIIFNGEIYNHWEIRKPLEKKYNFKSTSDTETILYAYIEYGIKVLEKLNGIFAFAVYDVEKEDIFLARDQLGVKPFYFYQDESKFLFSSELKSFLSFEIDKTISYKGLANYLTFLWSPGAETPFLYCKKLLPGHFFKFNIKNFTKAIPKKYYQIEFSGKYLRKSERELIVLLEEKLIKAVERQMLSDVPIGFFLSGGLDSSLLVAMAKKLHPKNKFPCFTIDTKNLQGAEGFTDDLFYAKKVAKYLEVDLNIVVGEIDIVKDFDKMIWHLDEPQADAAPLNVLNICKAARKEGIKVLIGGAGGDDLFSGYRRHQALYMEKYIENIPSSIRHLIKMLVSRLPFKSPFIRRIKKLSENLEKKSSARMAGYFSWLPYKIMLSLFKDKNQRALRDYFPTEILENFNKDIPAEGNALNQMLYWELKSFLVDHNLNYTDKLSMAEGIEARVPFLDIELVEFATKIPPSLKLKNKETKYLLKKVAEKYLPMDVIYRPKTGFGAPVRKWITHEMDSIINDKLSIARINSRGIFNNEKVQELIKRNKSEEIDASYSIWSLLAIESWMQQFVDKKI